MKRITGGGYRLFVEVDGEISRGRLFDPDGLELGRYVSGTTDYVVESACITLLVLGAPDDASALRRHWEAQQGAAS